MYLKHFFRFMRPDDDLSTGGGGEVVDKGDDFTPTGDDAPKDAPREAAKEAPKGAPGDKDPKEGLRDAGLEVLDPEEAPEEVPKEEKEPKGKDTRVPLSRHTEILNKERAKNAELARQLAQYQNGQKVAQVNDEIVKAETTISEMEAKYNKHMVDGEVDKATEVMSRIRAAERELGDKKSDLKMQAVAIQARESARYDVAVERVEAAYPALNPDHDDFDEAQSTEVSELKDAFMRQGRTPTDALQKAVKYVMGAPKTAAEKTATEVTPRVAEVDVAAQRKKEATAKAAATIAATPANTSKAGLDSDKIGGAISAKDVMGMPQEEFAKLPESVLSKMRGDEI